MKIRNTIAAAALVAVAGCAGGPNKESAGEWVDGSSMTARVKLALMNAENLEAGGVSVDSFKGRVQLSGYVPSETDKRRAAVVARNVYGVRSVTNGIEVTGERK